MRPPCGWLGLASDRMMHGGSADHPRSPGAETLTAGSPSARRLDRGESGDDQQHRRYLVRPELMVAVNAHDAFDEPGERFLDRGELEGGESGDQVGSLGWGIIGCTWPARSERPGGREGDNL